MGEVADLAPSVERIEQQLAHARLQSPLCVRGTYRKWPLRRVHVTT